MSRLLIFGPGYTASRIAAVMTARGWEVRCIGRTAIDDAALVGDMVRWSSHILSSIPPDGGTDPVLARHGDTMTRHPRRIAYLSSTGVYGDTRGAWIDESHPPAVGRRAGRVEADRKWATIGPDCRVFRLPGIYGPGRSPLDRLRDGTAHRIDLPGQMFSRVHVDDIVGGVALGLERGPPGLYNLADDLPASQADVVGYAASLLGIAPPPLMSMDEAGLSPMARGFYATNRRVANGKAKRLLGWSPIYPTYREGLRALSATTSPASASPPPDAASQDQR